MLPLLGVGKTFAATTLLLKDTFTDVNGTSITAHTMDHGPGWIAENGAGGTDTSFVIQSDQCQNTTASVRAAWSNAGLADATVTANLGCSTADPNNVAPGLGVRITDANNLWIGQFLGNGTIQIVEVVSGVNTVRASSSFAPANLVLYPCSLKVSGTTISFTVNNGTPISYSSMGSGTGVTNFGLNEGGGNPASARLWSNFQVTNP